jgi:phage gp36-like protein
MPNFIVQPGHAIHDGHKVRNEGEPIELTDADAELLTASGHVALAAAENQAPQPTEEELAAQAAAEAAAAYTLPLVTLPPRLLEVAADLVRYELYGHAAPEEVKARRDAAIAFLERVAKGELTVAGLTPEPVPGEVFAVSYAAKDRVFSDDALAGF